MHCERKGKSTKAGFLEAALLSFWLLLFSCCSRGFADVEPNQAEPAGLQLRVMTFNIRYGSAGDGENRWKKRKQMVFDIFKNHKTDVAGLQEALTFQIDEILESTPGFGMIGIGRNDGVKKGEYCAILYDSKRFDVNESGTFWFSDTPEVPGSTSWGNSYTRICTWARLVERKSSLAFYIYNVHLDHQSQPSREKSVALLAERIGQRKYKEPFVVTGDFNAGENNPAVLFLKGKAGLDDKKGWKSENPIPLADTFRILYPDAKDVGTFNQFKGISSDEKIDYIFTKPEVKILEAAILHDNTNGRYPSDHFPVTALLILPTNDKD